MHYKMYTHTDFTIAYFTIKFLTLLLFKRLFHFVLSNKSVIETLAINESV